MPRKTVKRIQFKNMNIISSHHQWNSKIITNQCQLLEPKKIKPVAVFRTKINQTRKALEGFTKSLKTDKDPLVQFQNTRKNLFRGFLGPSFMIQTDRIVETMKVTFTDQEKSDKNIYKSAYFNSRTQVIISINEFHEDLQTFKQQILNSMAVWLSEGSRWTIFSLDEHYINTDIYIPLKGSSYIQLPKELKNLEKGLINLSNKDDECFRWCHIRNLNPQEKKPSKDKKE